MSDQTGLIKVQKPDEEAFIRPIHAESPSLDRYGQQYSYQNNTDEASKQVRELWRRILKHKWLIVLIALIVTSIVTVEVFRDKNIYSATATVQIEKENRTLFRSGDVEIEAEENDYGYQTSLAMKTKIRVIQSRPLLEDVVVLLKLDQNPDFMATTERKNLADAIKSLGDSISFGKQKTTVEAGSASPEIPPSESLFHSDEESARLAPFVEVLLSYISADPIEDTRMLAISYRHSDPKLAAAIANATANVFIDRSYRGKRENIAESTGWLSTKTRELQSKVQQAELALANYTNQNNIFSTDGKDNLTADKLSKLHAQAMEASTNRLLKESLYEEVKQGRVAQLPESYADPKTTALQAKLGELTTQMAQMRVKLGTENPKVVELNKQIAAIQKQVDESRVTLADRLKADYERAARDEQSLNVALNQAKNEAAQQNQNNIRFSILKQELETAKALYTDFLQKTNQANLQVASQANKKGKGIELIERAQVPASPVGPNRLRTILIGLLLSMAAGVALALFIEFLNNTIKSVEDVSHYLGLPTLALVPTLNRKAQQQLANGSQDLALAKIQENGGLPVRASKLSLIDNRSTFAESYRALRTSVLLSAAGNPPRTILLTSSSPGEGKTTTAINTAIAFAQLKARTLLIDADMRRPTIHKLFGTKHSQGLSTYLSSDVKVEDLIQKLPIANLYLLPCGMIPPDPSELISSERMKELLQILSTRFQYIVIDSPPLINVSDPIILSTLVDGVIFVVKGGDTKRSIVSRARQELANVGARIFGVVINNINLKSDGYDDYYYQRYHSEYAQERTELNNQ
jgi:capsular exopolysaccharide synthesis family protein